MAQNISALPSYEADLHGEGLVLAGSGFGRGTMKKIGRGLKTASRVADRVAPLVAIAQPELAPAIGTAMLVKKAIEGSGVRGAGFGRGTQRKVLKAAKKGASIADKLVNEFGSDSHKRQAAKARRIAEIVGSGKPGAALRKRVMAHYA